MATPPSARRFGRYPEYRDSGVEWLGEIPAHWDVTRLKRISKIVNGGTPKTSERRYWNGPITWITPDDLGRTTGIVIRESNRSITSAGLESCGAQLVPAGSLVLSTRAPIGHLAVARTDLCTNQGCRSLVFRDQRSCRYVFYQLATARGVLQSRGAGSTFRELSSVNLETLAISAPPLSEQRAIADFLDKETAKIDALIANKEGLVDLLQEKRTALITRAVTRGLNTQVPTRESGVEWLGDVPEHWDVQELRHLIDGRLAYGANAPADYTDPAWPRYLRITDFSPDGTLRPDTFRSLPPDVARTYLVEPGDVLLARSGATVGKAFLVREGSGRACHAGYLIRARPDSSLLLPDFLFAFVRSAPFAMWKEMTLIIATIQNIGADKYANLPVPTPPLKEQRAVVAFLDRETSRIDALAGKAKDVIKKLEEYRMALISAAVTGKIDVRNYRDGRTVTDPSRPRLMS